MALSQPIAPYLDYPATSNFRKTNRIPQEIQEREEQLAARDFVIRDIKIFALLNPTIFETSASGVTVTEFGAFGSENAATTFFVEMHESAEVVETAPKKGMSLREAVQIQEEIYKKLKEEIEEGRRAEARYWQFLNEDIEG